MLHEFLVRKFLSIDECVLKVDENATTFEGYGARFGVKTEGMVKDKDAQGDIILAGAFTHALRTYGKPKMFFQHEHHMPIGKWAMAKEDDTGLYLKGEFTPGNRLSDDVRAGVKHGTIDGLSIGGFVKREDTEELDDGTRLLKKFSRLLEVSVVVFPAQNGARVNSVKAEDVGIDTIDSIETEREMERFLRDAGGLSKGLALALVSRAKTIFGPGEPVQKNDAATKALDDTMARIRAATTF